MVNLGKMAYGLAYLESMGGEENMKRDWENLLLAQQGKRSFRLYTWEEKTLSIGYSQDFLNFPIKMVKRPTGGGALLHGWDVSFSYAGLREEWGKSFKDIYTNFMGLLLELLREFDSSFEMSKYRGGYENYFCYFYPTLGEITTRGKKIVACAMRLMKDCFLIHGSLFLDMDYEYFEKLTGIGKEKLKERITTFRELGFSQGDMERLLKTFYLKINSCL
ncbi:MAG: lipoyl protein ligase domain-containing protein [Aquificaceae bacterium]